MKKAKKSKAPFTVKQRKGMIEGLEEHDYSAVVETAIERLRSGLHLELSEPRRMFVCAICDHENPAIREHLVACIRVSLFGGMERWNGMVEWNGGME